MYDLSSFIECLNKKRDSFREALLLIKDDFKIGKVEIKANDFSECLGFVLDKNIADKAFMTYSNNGYEYILYCTYNNQKYSLDETKDITLILQILSLYHSNYILYKKSHEGELISYNTKLPNAHGYLKIINTLSKNIDPRDYNAYYINLKGFGLINRIYNSEIGDAAIIYYANRLKDFIGIDEVVGHLGGDNFVAFIKKKRHDDFVELASFIPVDLKINNIRASFNLTGVIGYCEIVKNKLDYAETISNASIACQYARATKKQIIKLTDELLELVNSTKKIENTFKEELKKGSFIVYYQPKFDIKTNKIVGVEALSRWVSNGKIVPPGLFVPILEKNGDILDLDLFVLENLCKDIHNYRNQGHNIVPASCNLSRKDFENDGIEEKIINIIKRYNVKTQDIVIEVTETTNLEENERLAKFINVMWKNGIMTSIDDFGTGYSSLSVLRDFKVNEIKIDRSFINRDILTESDEIIIGSIIDMAKRLNISVICEGVETKKQAEFLVNLGCYKAQGYYYSKPIPKLEFEDMLQKIGTIYD